GGVKRLFMLPAESKICQRVAGGAAQHLNGFRALVQYPYIGQAGICDQKASMRIHCQSVWTTRTVSGKELSRFRYAAVRLQGHATDAVSPGCGNKKHLFIGSKNDPDGAWDI